MANHRRHAYPVFADSHRKFGATKGEFAPTLRIKALAAAMFAGTVFWGTIIYFIAR